MSQRKKRKKRRSLGVFPSNFERDWKFYCGNRKKFTFCGRVVVTPEYDEDGLTAKECFYVYDTNGKLCKCSEPELFHEVLLCKKSVGFHIKQWAEGYTDVCSSVDELLSFADSPPDWIKVSVKNQIINNLYNNYEVILLCLGIEKMI
ncbi:MAG: hypothetical protein GY861_22440 [bacterium]|nr:hypothetical protein [bacterium]